MRKIILSGAWLTLTCAAQFGCLQGQQAPVAELHFEVASIRPVAPLTPGRVEAGRLLGMQGGPGTSAPGQINYGYVTLIRVLTAVYGIKAYQISGPAWLGSEHYDIVAKVPPQTTKEQLNRMLRNLLAERFNMTVHRATKVLDVYEVLVGKTGLGPKLKESVEDPGAAGGVPAPPLRMLPTDNDGFPQLPAGRPGMIVIPSAAGKRIVARALPLLDLLNMIDLGRPILDKTGLTGKFDFTVEYSTEGLNLPVPSVLPGGGPSPIDTSPDEGGPSIFEAFEKQLGLKLEAKKDPVEMLVLDRIDKVPTEN
jgi:uncharacterized protein (TIGR03435 family)